MTNRGTTRRTVLTGAAALGAAATLPLTPAGPAHAASGTTARTGAEDAAALRTRWHTLLTGGPGLDRDDARIAAATARVGRAGATATGLDPSRTDGLFPDLTSTTLSNHVTTSFKRLATAATAWAVPGTPQHGDAALLAMLLGGVDWMLTHRYGPEHTRFDNDWDWEIGAALALNDTAVLLHDELGAKRLERVTAAVLHYTPDPNLWRANRQIATGANRVWVSTVVAVNAVLRGDGDALGRVRDALSDVEGSGANSVLAFNDTGGAAAGTGEGFSSDGSFLQHYKHPYNGGYGKELLGNLSRLLNLLAGTAWTVTDPDLDNVRGWVDDGFDPLMFRGDVMASVCGREIARPNKQGHASAQTVLEAVLRLIPCFPGEPADRFTALVKQWIAEDGYRDFLAVTDLASLVAAQAAIASAVPARGPLVAHKQHPLMDKAAHHRPAFGLGISAYSTRIYNYESIRHENLRGWHLSDGMVLLYTDDLGHYSEDYWPTVDPTRLPGTTVIAGRPVDAAGQRTTSTAGWAGGTALPDTTLGAYGMELRAFGSTLHGLKSWFCLDDVIACVGSGITAEAGTADTPDIGPEGHGSSSPGFLTRGIEDPHRHYYRRLITDAVRAVDAARAHEAVDAGRVAVLGGSQGGGLALAVAGLRDDVAAAVADVPFLCHYRRASQITDAGPYAEIARWLSGHRFRIEEAMETLSYFDGVNFAARASAPAWFSVGLMDRVCPSSTVFAAYHRYAGPAEIGVFPYNGHEGGAEYDLPRKLGALRGVFGA
ncbi:acetylxylan esterase [Streptomyces sp. NPDC098077]